MSLDAKCESCGKGGPSQFDDDMNILCPDCFTAGKKPTFTCPVCLQNTVKDRDDVCSTCRGRSGI